jgi:predicted SAM-dependent methyltransferase/polyisoprenoid-binding protein YceI
MSDAPLRLHVGSGSQRLEGWVNIDRQALPGVDFVGDVTEGLPFENAEAVFAEHFLEHLPLDQAVAFLVEAHRVLAPGGRIRLSTPNLDWVVATQYAAPRDDGDRRVRALRLNRSFHGWSHRFLWNRELLADVLAAVGFDDVRWYRHGESDWAPMRGLERHEVYADEPDLPHVLVVEARKGEPKPGRLADVTTRLRSEFLAAVRPRGWQIDAARSSVIVHVYLRGPLRPLVREHVLRVAWVGGAVHVYPEAPRESRIVVDLDLRHLVVDEPVLRAMGGLPRVPGPVQRRVERRVRGEWLDVERGPLATYRADTPSWRPGGSVAWSGALELHGATIPLSVEATASLEHDVWRARGQLALDREQLALPPWSFAGGLLRDSGPIRVDFDLVAAPMAPT